MPLEPDEQGVIDDIAEHGWSGALIPEDEVGPGFEYTIGLMAGHDHPEVIIFGLSSKLGHDILWQVFNEIRAGRAFREPGLYEDILVGNACRMQGVHPTWYPEYFGYALWHRRHANVDLPFAAMQCLWPDKNGLFPGEQGCAAAVASLQPDLSKPMSPKV